MNKWEYEEYSNWSRSFAKNQTKKELKKYLLKTMKDIEKTKISRLRAIEGRGSPNSKCARNAHLSNRIGHLGDLKMSITRAIELHDLYPEKCKQ